MTFEFEFKAYGGQCVSVEGKCTDDIHINREHIEGNIEDLTCELRNSNCNVSFNIRNFRLNENGKVGLKLAEAQSLCSGISLKVEASSSIPGEVSSITDVVWSEKEQFFRGSTPTTFSYLMTPSLFKSDSTKWKHEQTGYHILVQQDPTKGSRAYVSE